MVHQHFMLVPVFTVAENVILGDGTLHVAKGGLFDFAIGAVRQHFTKTLNRIPSGGGVYGDFRFPTRRELIALEAFQRSTGRQQELALPLSLNSPLASAGQTDDYQFGGQQEPLSNRRTELSKGCVA
jgi:hypothetical protein